MNDTKQYISFANSLSRLWWVIRTYTSNLWHWLIFIVAVAMLAGEFAGSRATINTYIADISPHAPSFRTMGKPEQIEEIDLGKPWLDFQKQKNEQIQKDQERVAQIANQEERTKQMEGIAKRVARPGPVTDDEKNEFFKQFDQYPNLKSVKLRYLPFPDFDRLAKLEKLESLTIYAGEGSFGPEDINKLAPLRKLKRIELFMYGARGVGDHKAMLEDSVRALADLPALETLVISYFDNFDNQSLESIASLSQIKTLVLGPPSVRTDRNKMIDKQLDFSILQKSRSLKEFYVNQKPGVNLRQVEDVTPIQAVLPNVKVFSLWSPKKTGISMWMLLVGPMSILPMIVGRVLVFQYRTSMNRLVPRYHRNHILVAVCALGSICLYFAWRMTSYGYDFYLAFFSIAIVAVFICWGQTAKLENLQNPVKKQFQAVAFLALIYAIYVLYNKGWIPRYYYPFLAVSIGGLIAAVAVLVSSLRSLILNPQETIATTMGWNQWSKGGMQAKVLNNREKAVLVRECEIESLESETKFAPLSFWKKVARWRMGNRPNPMTTTHLLAMLPLMCVTYYYMMKVSLPELASWTSVRSQIGFFSLVIPLIFSSSVGAMWRARLGALPIELLKPTSRTDLLRGWKAGLFRDILPLPVTFSILPAVILNTSDQFEVDWISVAVSLPMFAIVQFSSALVTGMAMLTIERGWLVWVVCFGLLYGALGAFAGSLFAINGFKSGFSPFQFRNELGYYIPVLLGSSFLWIAAFLMGFLWMRKKNFDYRN